MSNEDPGAVAPLERREFLQLGGLAGLAAALGPACGGALGALAEGLRMAVGATQGQRF